MKLVELLAREVSEWHENTQYAFQDLSGTIYCTSKGKPKFKESWQEWNVSPSSIEMSADDPLYGITLDTSSDHAESVVDRAQWQAERDRQKGGEWKRHRGGKQPVANDVQVEVKFRDGEIRQSHASDFFSWVRGEHDLRADIMQYRVISQPQAEEVEVNKFCMGENCNATAESIVHSRECETEHEAAYTGVWAQSTGPLAWRDTIIHCQAIIEDCEREIQANVNLLDSEGLFMQLEPKKGMQAYDMNDWRNWKDGDKIRMTADDWCDLSKGEIYEIIDKGRDYITILDDVDYRRKLDIDGETMFDDGRLVDFEFVSSP